jgi:hydroxyacylglutathione hydrolase
MIQIHQKFVNNQLRNFTYIISVGSDIICIDPYSLEIVEQTLEKIPGAPKVLAIINTHEHHDHTEGNEAVIKKYGCEVWGHQELLAHGIPVAKKLKHLEEIKLSNTDSLKILHTPGHSAGSISLLWSEKNQDRAMFSGDTLFNAGVGNCRDGGKIDLLYSSVQEFYQGLNDEVMLYPGHDYLEKNLSFSESVSGHKYNVGKISNFGRERQINLFLQANNFDSFKSLREKRDIF